MCDNTSDTGFYWFYTLDNEGNRLETTPDVCWYKSETNEVTSIGYDIPLTYSRKKYDFVAKVLIKPEMSPTKKTVTEEEYHECSSDRCPRCSKRFYIMASGWNVSQGYECPHCDELVLCPEIRKSR